MPKMNKTMTAPACSRSVFKEGYDHSTDKAEGTHDSEDTSGQDQFGEYRQNTNDAEDDNGDHGKEYECQALTVTTAALLELFAASTRAGVVATNLGQFAFYCLGNLNLR